MTELLVHALIAVVIFYVVNWIGGHALGFGYTHLTPFADVEDAPLFNVVYRIVAPNVLLLLAAAAMYQIGAERYVADSYRIIPFYFAFRWVYIFALGRRRLTRWGRQLVVATISVAIAWQLYDRFIQARASLLPRPSELSTELWLVVLLFVYHTLNKVEWPGPATGTYRVRYITTQYWRFVERFGVIIKLHAGSTIVQALSYSVLIYEGYNRPPLYQRLERWVLFPLGQSHSFGPMQVRADKPISDADSVERGVKMLASHVREEYLASVEGNKLDLQKGVLDVDAFFSAVHSYEQHVFLERVCARYNIRSDYPWQVIAIFDTLVERFFKTLEPVPVTRDA